MNNTILNHTETNHPLVNIGALVLGIYALNKIFGQEKDTLNYTLWHKNRLVYHGICYTDRLDARLNEHELRGLMFDEFDHGSAKPRNKALLIEKRLIRKDKPKYNYHHNY